ncbi:MAG: HNH endonuclease family protein, partial [Bacteriovoracia bacterium]
YAFLMKLLLALIIVTSSAHQSVVTQKYNRKHWKHWTDADRDCQNTRHEILISRSLLPVSFDRKKCVVMRGKWNDYYYPEVHTWASRVDIDHLVPLKNAHETGGAGWSKKKKKAFANDPENLVITNLKYNRKKGSKGIDKWLPVHQDYACKYIKDWMKIKKKYSLKITEAENMAIKASRCNF